VVDVIPLFAPTESAHKKYDQAYHKHQSQPAATVNRTAIIKTAATEQKEQNDQ
jgi:hypothetical protein